MLTKENIILFLQEHRQELLEKFGLVKVGLFGSYARGEQTEKSDIDLAVEIESENKFRSFFALKAYLEDHLKERVDLGIESTLKPAAKKYIEKEIIYA